MSLVRAQAAAFNGDPASLARDNIVNDFPLNPDDDLNDKSNVEQNIFITFDKVHTIDPDWLVHVFVGKFPGES